jgi:methionine sulfoxide reductase heme-binding subunit
VSSATIWYAARGAGVVAYLLVTATVLLGVTLAGRRVRVLPRFALEEVHRYLGLLTGVFLAIHVGGVLLDTVVPFSLTQIVIPFTAGYRPLWTGLGVVALELLAALAITNRLRGRLPYRVWRTLHVGSFAVWGLATVHGVLSGTDRDTAWGRLLFAGAAAAVVAAVCVRLVRRPAPAPALSAALAAAVAAAGALALSVVPLSSTGGDGTVRAHAPLTLSAPFDGTVSQREGPSAVLVSVSGTVGAGRRTEVRIDLLRTRAGVDTSLQVLFPSGVGCSGDVTALDGGGFTGECTTAAGGERRVSGVWSVIGERVTGTVDVATATGTASGAAS